MESKSDLLKKNENYEEEIKKFAEKNGFDGGFTVSSKEGININESFEFLMNTIIERMELMLKKGINCFIKENNFLTLEPKKLEGNEKIGEFVCKDLGEKLLVINGKWEDNDLLELYIINDEDGENNKYSCEINIKKIKKKYEILKPIKGVKDFIDILKELNHKSKIKIKFYLKKIMIQIGIIFITLIGDEEEINFNLICENTEKENLIKYLINEIIKEKENINNIKNKNEDLESKSEDS